MPKTVKLPVLNISAELDIIRSAINSATKKLNKQTKLGELESFPQGALSDFLYDLRELNSQVSHAVDPVQELLYPLQKLVEEHFVAVLAVGESSGLQGFHSRVQITESPVPIMQDRDKFNAYVSKTKQFDLLNQTPNTKAIRERWDDGKQIPGITVFHAKKVSCTKISGKKPK